MMNGVALSSASCLTANHHNNSTKKGKGNKIMEIVTKCQHDMLMEYAVRRHMSPPMLF